MPTGGRSQMPRVTRLRLVSAGLGGEGGDAAGVEMGAREPTPCDVEPIRYVWVPGHTSPGASSLSAPLSWSWDKLRPVPGEAQSCLPRLLPPGTWHLLEVGRASPNAFSSFSEPEPELA